MTRLTLLLVTIGAGATCAATMDDPSPLHVFLLVFAVCAVAVGVGMLLRREDRTQTCTDEEWDEVEFQEFLRALDRTRGES